MPRRPIFDPLNLKQKKDITWLDTKGAAKHLGLSENAIRTRVCRGTLTPYKDGRRLLFIKQELDELLLKKQL